MDPLNPSAGAAAAPPKTDGEAVRGGLRPALLRWLASDGYGSIVVLALLIWWCFRSRSMRSAST